MNQYQLFLSDGITAAELDVESTALNLSATFQTLDISNIGSRKDNLKTIKFKSTKRNNQVLGHYYNLSKTTNPNIPANLGANFNPLVDCKALLYENSTLIFDGTFRLTDLQTDKNGNVIYSASLTGGLIDLKTQLQDMLLSDIDLSDMQHLYEATNIVNSWETATVRFNPVTSGYTSVPFAYGTGYVYGDIDYGIDSSGATIYSGDSRNYKPGVYLSEYLNRIFAQDALDGYTYEIKGSADFKNMVKHLVVLDAQERNQTTLSGFVTTYSSSSGATRSFNGFQVGRLYPISTIVQPPVTSVGHFLEADSSKVLNAQRHFVSSAKVVFNLNAYFNNSFDTSDVATEIQLQLVKRKTVADESDSGWDIVGTTAPFSVPAVTMTNTTLTLNLNSIEINEDEQVGVMIYSTGYNLPFLNSFSVTANSVTLSIPSNANQPVVVDLLPDVNDLIIPKAPAGITQINFLKLVTTQLNLIASTAKNNSRHIIFELFDDYNILFRPENIKRYAIDLSSKVDYKNGLKLTTNISLPKKYTYSYASADDYFSKQYKQKWGIGYGDFQFSDSAGLIDTLKIELPSSALILVSENGSNRKRPALYDVDGGNKKPMATNLRLAYYNGMQPCDAYNIYSFKDGKVTDIYFDTVTGTTRYPQISNYYLSGGTVINDLHFNRPIEIQFAATNDYFTAPNSYQNYYQNQVSQLTDADAVFVDANILLNENDIQSLDLRVPVYIDSGNLGAAYYRVIKVTYTGSDNVSKVNLQRVTF